MPGRQSFLRAFATCGILILWALTTIDAQAQDQVPDLGREVGAKSFDRYIFAESIAWSPDQSSIAIATSDSTLTSYDPVSRAVNWQVAKAVAPRAGIAFTPDGRHLITVSLLSPAQRRESETSLHLRDARTGALAHSPLYDGEMLPRPHWAQRLVLSPDGSRMAAKFGGRVLIYDTGTWTPIKAISMLHQSGQPVRVMKSIVIDAARDRLIFAGAGGTIRHDDVRYVPMQTWRISDGSRLADFTTYKTGLQSMILEPASGHIITGGDGVVVPFQAPPPVLKEKVLGVEDDPVTKVRAYDPISGALVREYPGPGGAVDALCLSPDGRYLAALKARRLSERKDAYALVWETATGRLIAATNLGQGLAHAMSFSPDGKRLALSVENVVRIFELDPKLLP